jgi:Uma2 family endonuclease
MQIEIQSRPDAIQRWQELLADPELARWPGRIETDRFGRVLMSPPPAFGHTRRTAKIIRLLLRLLPDGQAAADTPIKTLDGIKVTDAAWFSLQYWRELADQDPAALERAPEICVEVLSPSNSPAEMDEKRALYFEAGAKEVWICGLDGKVSFSTSGRFLAASELCPQFAAQI